MKFMFVVMTLIISLSFSVCANAQIKTDRINLLGDDNFIKEILSESKEKSAFYVSTDGNDSNEGTFEKPFRTINKALEEAVPGTAVYVRGGEYKEYVYVSESGSENNYITLKNYGNEKPVIKGSGKNDTPLIDLDGHDYIKIEGFEICDSVAVWACGINLAGGENHIIIKNNKIHDIKCSKPDDPDNSGANGILLFGESKEPISNIYIGENEIYNLVTGWSEALSVTANCEYVNVVNNYVHDCTNIGIDFYGNNADGYCPFEELNQPRYCIASGNEVSGCICDYADCYGIYADGARDIIIENNVLHDNMGGIEIGSEERNEKYPVKNIVVRNNAAYNNSVSGITVGGWNDGLSESDNKLSGIVYNTKIINNTLRNNGVQITISMVDGVEIVNNIFDGEFLDCMKNKNVVKNIYFDNNLYYNEDGFYVDFIDHETENFAVWKEKNDKNGINANPIFSENTFFLGENSPSCDKGKNVECGEWDIMGNARISGSAVDIGAFEYGSKTDANYADAENTADMQTLLEYVMEFLKIVFL